MAIERVEYFAQPNCYRLSNATTEAIVTTDIGPRVIRYGFKNAENILGEVSAAEVETALGVWKPWGGHRLWTAPEAMPRSYAPDNKPVKFEIEEGKRIRLTQTANERTGIEKEMLVELDAEGSGLSVRHKIINRGLWAIDVAAWAITIMNGGGQVIIPQEPYRSWDEYLLPARPLVLWHYTDLSDSRWTLGKKYLQLKTDEALKGPQKIGVANKQGWAAYHRAETLFVKRFSYSEGASYPDYGSNNETYTAGTYIELETLAPLQRLEPGDEATHDERWFLFDNFRHDENEDSLDAAIHPLLAQTTH